MTIPALGPTPPIPAAAPPAHRHHTGFGELLSELNPLQYIPVVGTIYRAVTGDTIPDTARTVGSLVVSGLTGGPIGVALSVAAMAVEHAIGIDPERIGRTLLADIGVGHPAPAVPIVAPAPEPAPQTPWSPAQLQVLGVATTAGTLRLGALQGSDVLNALELTRLAQGNRV